MTFAFTLSIKKRQNLFFLVYDFLGFYCITMSEMTFALALVEAYEPPDGFIWMRLLIIA